MPMFYWQWFKRCLGHWTLVSVIATALPLIFPIIAKVFPRVGASMGELAWKIPVLIFLVLWVARFFLAPYWMFKEKEEQALIFALEAEEHKREADQLKRTLENTLGTQRGEPDAEPQIEVVIGTTEVAHTMSDFWIADIGNNPFVRERLTGVVALVSNVPAKVGKKTSKAYGLAASVTIYDEQDRRIGSVSRTYWLSNSANNLNLESGEHRTLLVAAFIDDYLALYENPRTDAVRFRSARQVVNTLPIMGMSPSLQKFGTFVRIDLTLISTETGETMAIAKARLSR
jgi:hypothetical protein